MKKVLFSLLVVGIFLTGSSFNVYSADMPKEVAAGKMEMAKAPEMTAEQKEMQARMQAYSTPNANHEVLKALEGNWKSHVQFWMDPKAPAQESDGTAEAKMIMNGRFLEQHFNGNMMGQPFEGRALIG